MSDIPLPVHYVVEIYEDSFDNDPCKTFNTTMPVMTFHIGELIDPTILNLSRETGQPKGEWLKIINIAHQIWEIDRSHVGHQIRLCVKYVPRPY